MVELVYSQMAVFGSNTAGFRNSSEEVWVEYRTPMNEAVLAFAPDGMGYAPLPGWTRLHGE